MSMDAATLWTLPELGAPTRREPEKRPPTVQEIEAIEAQARREGYAAGHAEGLAAAQGEMRRLAAQFEGVVDALARPLGKLEDEVAGALGELAVRIAGVLVGPAYQADPMLLAELVRAALDAVGSGQRELEVRLHPDDIMALSPHLPSFPDARLVPDLSLGRGDVRVHAESVRIDGRLEARLRAALEATLRQGGAP